ncbi:kinase-like protein [Thelephora ganbajun]|uniref:Kinase-like protein n=1 Tax=Thelephora ganbajun TaxID=370292 RepID=A0ACB6Z6G6_THEGA|nr:kinase-like protein [Thelephora ganbajun]
MAPPGSPALRKLHSLDTSSSDFGDQLCNVLYGGEYEQCVPNLQGNDLVWLVDYLDKALNDLDPSSTASRRCLRELRNICSTREILPSSYTISLHLLNISPDPFAHGSFGDVYHGTLDGTRICIKRLQAFCQEAVVRKRLAHPNIVPLLGITITPFHLISDWMSGGDLPEHIKNNSNADRIGLLSDVAMGLCYLHSCNVIHGDLKGPNILVDGSGHARIGDFGFANITQHLDSIPSASIHRGHAPRLIAPEVLNGGPPSKEADIFSFAMVTIEVFTGAIPFSDNPPPVTTLSIIQGKRPSRPTHPTFTENLWELILETIDQPRPCHHERISLIEEIFSDHNQAEMIGYLSADDAQTLIDVIDEASAGRPLGEETHRNSMHYLARICDHSALLPRSLQIPLCYDLSEIPHHSGGLVNVWKGQYKGREVAAKALRVSLTSDFGRIGRRFCMVAATWRSLRHPNVLPLLGVTMAKNQFITVSEWMHHGNINEFLKKNINVDRPELRVIHGDLNALTHPKLNILINDSGHACLSGFNLVGMVPEQSTEALSMTEGGTTRWMSPELLDLESFGLEERRPTRESDCYALGMLVYEVLSGRVPFAPAASPIPKILRGERPARPQGEGGKLFTDGIWKVVELCWRRQPRDRASAKDIFRYLEGAPPSPRPSPNARIETRRHSVGQSDVTAGSPSTFPPSYPRSIVDYPRGIAGPTIAHGNGEPQVPPRNIWGRWFDSLARLKIVVTGVCIYRGCVEVLRAFLDRREKLKHASPRLRHGAGSVTTFALPGKCLTLSLGSSVSFDKPGGSRQRIPYQESMYRAGTFDFLTNVEGFGWRFGSAPIVVASGSIGSSSFASPIFREMFQLRQPSSATSNVNTISDVIGPSQALEVILCFTYPSTDPPTINDLTLSSEVLVLADKCNIGVARSRLRTSLVRFARTEPLGVYAIVCRLGFEGEMKIASSRTTSIHLPGLTELPEEFKLIPATECHRLILLHARYRHDPLADSAFR